MPESAIVQTSIIQAAIPEWTITNESASRATVVQATIPEWTVTQWSTVLVTITRGAIVTSTTTITPSAVRSIATSCSISIVSIKINLIWLGITIRAISASGALNVVIREYINFSIYNVEISCLLVRISEK